MSTAAPVAHEFTIRRKIFTLFGAKFHVYNNEGELIGFSKQKAFKLKEDIRFYSDETMETPVMGINARNIIDFSAAYDVTDSKSGEKVGALRRQGMSSFVQDEWHILDTADQQVGKIQEDSMAMSLVRRLVPMGNWVPQSFHVYDNQENVFAMYRTHFNPFIHRMTVSIYENSPLSPHIVLAGAILLLAIEGRQQQ